LKKLNTIDRPLANLTKMRKETTQISKIRHAKKVIITNNMEIREQSKTSLKTYIPINLNLVEMDKFLDTYDQN
jgi:hypothetical protein